MRDALRDVEPDGLVHEARLWRAAGFEPGCAENWQPGEAGLGRETVEMAVHFENAGWYAFHAYLLRTFLARLHAAADDATCLEWLALGLPVTVTLNYVKAGVTPEQAVMFEALALDPRILLTELRKRAAALPEFTQWDARKVNMGVFLLYGTDVPHAPDLPFCYERLRDIYVEDEEAAVEVELREWQENSNSANQRLVAVIEVGDDVSEDTDAQASWTMRVAAVAAAVEAVNDETDLVIRTERLDNYCVATAPDGRGYAAVTRGIRGRSFRGKREPTEAETKRWAQEPPS